MGYSPKFNMPDKTIGEKWHEEAENENPILAFLAFGTCMTLICLIVIVVGGTQNQAMGYFDKCEFQDIKEETVLKGDSRREINTPVEAIENQSVLENTEEDFVYPEFVTEETSTCQIKPDTTYGLTGTSYGDWMVAGGNTPLMTAGVQYSEDGTRYTWYSENVLPGGGLDIPGRHVGEGGFVMDGNGNLCVASSDHPIGTVLETPYGTAVVYDTGCDSGTVDMYTSW